VEWILSEIHNILLQFEFLGMVDMDLEEDMEIGKLSFKRCRLYGTLLFFFSDAPHIIGVCLAMDLIDIF
jgi:hypothetical protein